jgi:hypothetical protein
MTDLITEPSICIPRTLNNVTWRDVKDVFEKLFGKGTVDRVDIVRRRDDDSPFCRIFVHMRYWPMNMPEVVAWRDKLMTGQTLKVVYKQPWFWKCAASRTPKPVRERISSQPYIITEQTPKTALEMEAEEHLNSRRAEMRAVVSAGGAGQRRSHRPAFDDKDQERLDRFVMGDEAEPQSSGEQAGEAREAESEAQEQEDM